MRSFRFRYQPAAGLGPEPGVMRRDNSDVIRIDGLYHVWYTKGLLEEAPFPGYNGAPGYHGRIWHATSEDGLSWQERSCAIDKGPAGSLEAGGVFTPNILLADGRYWLGYCAVAAFQSHEQLSALPDGQFLAVADSPFGPWRRVGEGPFLWPVDDPEQFDSFRVDGLSFLRRDGLNWVYYKGRQQGRSPKQTKLGVATAEHPAGPWRRHPANPVVGSGHEVMFWPHREGVATVINWAGADANTVQYAPDGLNFRVVGEVVDPPDAPSHYCPDCFDETASHPGIDWGLCMVKSPDPLPYLVRWECPDLRFDPALAD